MSVNLPTTLLRSFVAIVDSGSMQGASQQVFLSQSALSFQVKKLESLVKQPLFQREGRRLVLTLAGQLLLDYSRRMLDLHDEAISAISSGSISGPIKVGIVQDYSEAFFRGVLSSFSTQYPDTQVYVKVSRTVQLKRLIADGDLDIAIGMSGVDDEAAVASKPTSWFGRPEAWERDVISLALLEAPCRFRDAAIASLEAAGRPYRIAVEAPNLSTLKSAVEAGLGITCRTHLFAGEELLLKGRSLPPLPKVGFAMHAGHALSAAAEHFKDVSRSALIAF